ncbi:hypothetical protein [Nocardia sp. 852002-51244_SCH5132740]|uniref:hypothetical protein n=1 Tax=Nocardia sp. 852002-51244_SCH5132740 TaxID=1834099 RepID=UPI0007EB6AE3|nr:hypothetical protein [Nocardia sp. 852002-51244_SCH5132740]OBB37061.1 hypothetical protein A5748_03920 [Nocardia sp. 852002-51244_SCH5132740]
MSAINEQLHRRAAAARRLPGGDPWPRTVRELDLSTHQLEAWAHAAKWIASDGNTPILPMPVLEALVELAHESGRPAA